MRTKIKTNRSNLKQILHIDDNKIILSTAHYRKETDAYHFTIKEGNWKKVKLIAYKGSKMIICELSHKEMKEKMNSYDDGRFQFMIRKSGRKKKGFYPMEIINKGTSNSPVIFKDVNPVNPKQIMVNVNSQHKKRNIIPNEVIVFQIPKNISLNSFLDNLNKLDKKALFKVLRKRDLF